MTNQGQRTSAMGLWVVFIALLLCKIIYPPLSWWVVFIPFWGPCVILLLLSIVLWLEEKLS